MPRDPPNARARSERASCRRIRRDPRPEPTQVTPKRRGVPEKHQPPSVSIQKFGGTKRCHRGMPRKDAESDVHWRCTRIRGRRAAPPGTPRLPSNLWIGALGENGQNVVRFCEQQAAAASTGARALERPRSRHRRRATTHHRSARAAARLPCVPPGVSGRRTVRGQSVRGPELSWRGLCRPCVRATRNRRVNPLRVRGLSRSANRGPRRAARRLGKFNNVSHCAYRSRRGHADRDCQCPPREPHLGTLLAEPGIESVGDRLAREGLEHHGMYLR